MLRRFALGCLVALLSLVVAEPTTAKSPSQRKLVGSPAEYAQNAEVLIVYQPGQAAEARAAADQSGFEVLEDYEPGSYLRCKAKPSVQAVAVSASNIAAKAMVRFVEPNYVVSIPEPAGPPQPAPANVVPRTAIQATGKTPNDALYDKLWGMANVRAPDAWETNTSSDIVVGVIDTGVDYTHEDLADNMWINVNETPGDHVDNDNNGIVDDVYGAKFDGGVGSGDPMDDNSHGSHCAGTIGAVGDNVLGVAGVNWNIKIMALKFLRASGSGTTNDAIRCIDYAIAQKQSGVNIRVLSNSWGGGGASVALREAITRAENSGILFVAAAGNASSDNDATPSFPASYDNENVISVASINRREELSWFSNFGAESVDLAAPGGTLEGNREDDILSTVPVSQDTQDGLQDGYSAFAGTSMATPHVAGAIALAWASPAHESKLPSQIKQLVLDQVRLLPALTGKCLTAGTLDISFLKDGAPSINVGPFVYAGSNDNLGGGFAVNGDSGSAMYVLFGSAYQSNLQYVGEGETPDGYHGWIYREDYPNAPFDFLLTEKTIGDVGYYRVYVRPADDSTIPFAWFCNTLRADELTINEAGLSQLRSGALGKLRNGE